MSNRNIFAPLGASNHATEARADYDFYTTEPKAARLLLEQEQFNHHVWECACGNNDLAQVFIDAGYDVRCSDIIDRCNNEVYDFLSVDSREWRGDIITNPPYKQAVEFIRKAISIVADGRKVAMFLRVQFLEGKERKKLFAQYPPKVVYVSSSRLLCAKNGDFETMRANGGSAVAYAWFVWQKGYKGDTIVKWIN